MSAFTPSTLYHYADDRAGVLDPIAGGAATFSRETGAYLWTGKRFDALVRNQPLFELVLDALGRETTGLLIERGSEPENADPLDVSAWTSAGSPTVAAASSVIEDEAATKLTASAAGTHKAQSAGVFTGSVETFSALVEGVPGALSAAAQVVVQDTTTPALAGVLNIDFTAGTVTASNGATKRLGRLLLPSGPNGGALYWVRGTYTGTGTNGRELRCYPDGVGGAAAAIFHAAWIEENAIGSNPLAAAVNRHALTYPAVPAGVPFWFVLEFRAGVRTAAIPDYALLHIGDGLGTDPRFLIAVGSADNTLRVKYDDGTTDRGGNLAATVAEGDHVLVTGLVASTGVLRAQASVNGGAIASLTSGTGGLASSWGGTTPRLRIGHADSTGGDHGRLYRLRSGIGALENYDSGATDAEIHALLKRLRVTRAGEILV